MTHAEAFARIEARLRELRARAMQKPLTAAQLDALEQASIDLRALVPQLTRYLAALEETRGPALEDARALLARIHALDLQTAMVVVTELRRAGLVRRAGRAHLALLMRAPHDAAFAERLAVFSMFLEEFGVNPQAGMTRTLSRALFDGWWRDDMAVESVTETLRLLDIDWARLPS